MMKIFGVYQRIIQKLIVIINYGSKDSNTGQL